MGVCTAGLELAQGGSLKHRRGGCGGLSTNSFAVCVAGLAHTHADLCHPTPVPVQLRLLQHRHARTVCGSALPPAPAPPQPGHPLGISLRVDPGNSATCLSLTSAAWATMKTCIRVPCLTLGAGNRRPCSQHPKGTNGLNCPDQPHLPPQTRATFNPSPGTSFPPKVVSEVCLALDPGWTLDVHCNPVSCCSGIMQQAGVCVSACECSNQKLEVCWKRCLPGELGLAFYWFVMGIR